jgi:D-lactate dehydrogenase (cytochrome)
VAHRIVARQPRHHVAAPPIEREAAIVTSFLSDAAHVPGGHAPGVAFPKDEAEVAALVRDAERVLPVGAQSSLTGGATPRGEIVLSMRKLTSIGAPAHGEVRVGAGVPLAELQRRLAERDLFYPPVPTFDGAFVGGTISTNAAGANTFKYGSTRPWVAAMTVVLANGDVLDVRRGDTTASSDGILEIELTSGRVTRVPVPTYTMPTVAKLSAGYFSRPGMDLVDLFVGSEGTLGVIVDASLRVRARPRRAVALVRCDSDALALRLTSALRDEASAAWQRRGPLDVSAIEYMDGRALRAVPDEAFERAQVRRPSLESVMLMLQIELGMGEDAAFSRLVDVLCLSGIADDPVVASPNDDRAAQRLFELREAVPASVNALVATAKARSHPDIEKTAGDPVVPFDRLADALPIYRSAFESRGLDYAIWGHISDGNLHTNLIPTTMEDVIRGRDAIVDIAHAAIGMGGAPLAEHGVGRSALKQRLLRELYGEEGVEQMRTVKRALDPGWKFAPGVLFAQ